MDWILLALLSPMLYAVAIVIDRFLLSKFIRYPFSYSIIIELMWIVFFLAVLSFTPLSFELLPVVFGTIAGALGMSGYFLYCKALHKEEASIVIPLAKVGSLFVTVMAFIFFREVFTPQKYLGIALLVAGVMLLSYKKNPSKHRTKFGILGNLPIISSALLIISMAFLYSLRSIVLKYTLFSIDFWSLFIWITMGEFAVVFAMLMKKDVRKELVMQLGELKRKKRFFAIAYMGTIFSFSAIILQLAAISLGPITLVSALSSINPIFVLLYVVILSVRMPKILKEEVGRSMVAIKAISTVLVIIGTIMVAM